MSGIDSCTTHTSKDLDSRLAPSNTNINSSLSHSLKNAFIRAYNDACVIILAGLGGIATVVYGLWGTDFAVLSAENGTDVAVPLVMRTTYNVNAWMAFNTLLNILGTASAGEGAKRLGKVIAERDFRRHESKTLEECLAAGNDKISKQELQAILCKESEIYVSEQLQKLEANPQRYWSRIKPKLTKIGLITYSLAQGGIVATFLLVNNNYNIDGGLIWNDLLIGAASGIIMYTAGKYYEGKAAFYNGLQKLKQNLLPNKSAKV